MPFNKLTKSNQNIKSFDDNQIFTKESMFGIHHHRVVPSARILPISCHPSLSFIASGRSSGLHPCSTFACPCEGVHRSTSLMSLSLLLQLCLAYLVHLILIVCMMGGRWPYSRCFVGCCLQDLFNIAHSILV